MSLRKEAMKKLDYIFSNGVVVEITGQGRGQGNSNSMPAKGAMLEEWVFKSFSRQGWDCEKSPYWIDMPNKSRFCPDIVLTKEGKIYGFVECYAGQQLMKKKDGILYIVDHLKPELFVLTDGSYYEVYFNGRYVDTMTVPISFLGFSQLRRMKTYYDLLGK